MHHLTPTRTLDVHDRNPFALLPAQPLASAAPRPSPWEDDTKIHCAPNERYFSSTVHATVRFARLTLFAGKNEFFNAQPGRASHRAGSQAATRAILSP